MMTIDELGKKFKRKYRGAYDHLSDAEVGRRALKKYPQYAGGVTDGMFDDPFSLLTSNLPEIDIDPKLAENLQPLLEYYNPERGVFTAWWQRRKSAGRTNLLKQVSEEYTEVIRQGALLEEQLRTGRVKEIEFRMFLFNNAFLLVELKTKMQLMESSAREGMNPGDFSDVNKEKALSQVRVDEHKQKGEIDIEHRWQTVVQDLNAADMLQFSERQVIDKLLDELERKRRKRFEIEQGNDPPALKEQLLSDLDDYIDKLRGQINARETRLLLSENGQEN